MGLKDIKKEFDTAEMAEDLTNSLPFSMPGLRKAFTDTQIDELYKLITDVSAAKSQNEKIAKLQDNIKAAFTLLKKLGVAL
jgi:hypothetical protein